MEPVVELRPGFLAAAIRQHWRLMVICALAGVFAMAGLTQLRGPSYSATAVVLLNPLFGNPYSPTTSTLRNDQLNSLETEAALVSTQAVAERAIEKSGGALGENAATQVSVEVVPAATVLRISFTDSSAAAASLGAQSFTEAFLDYRQAHAEKAIKQRIDLIDAQIKDTEGSLEDAERLLAQAGTSTAQLFIESQIQVYFGLKAQLDTEKVRTRSSSKDPGQVISPATPPTSPDGLPRWLLLAGGLIAGLATGVTIGLWREHNDDRIRRPEDVSALGLPRMLAVVPPASGRAMFEAASTEGFQLLRSAVLARLPRRPAAISIVPVGTESRSGELGFALATALERSGRRVALVLGQTRMHSPHVWVPPGPGLTDVLDHPGNVHRMNELLHQLSNNLWVLPPGRGLKDVADLYQSPVMDDVVGKLRGSADIVLVAAPSLDTAAGQALAGVADAVLLVVEIGETRYGALLEAYDEMAFRNIGVIGVAGVSGGGRRRTEPKRRRGADVPLGERLVTRPLEPRPLLSAGSDAEPGVTPAAADSPAAPAEPETPTVQPMELPKTLQPPRRAPVLHPVQPVQPPGTTVGNGVARPEAEEAPPSDVAPADAPTMTLPTLTASSAGPAAEPVAGREATEASARSEHQGESDGSEPRAPDRAGAPAASPPR